MLFPTMPGPTFMIKLIDEKVALSLIIVFMPLYFSNPLPISFLLSTFFLPDSRVKNLNYSTSNFCLGRQ